MSGNCTCKSYANEHQILKILKQKFEFTAKAEATARTARKMIATFILSCDWLTCRWTSVYIVAGGAGFLKVPRANK